MRVAPLPAKNRLHHRLRHVARERKPQHIIVKHVLLPILVRSPKHVRVVPTILAVLYGVSSITVLRGQDSEASRHPAVHRQSAARLCRAVHDIGALAQVCPGRSRVSEDVHGWGYTGYFIKSKLM